MTARRKTRDAEKTKAALLVAAKKVFAEHGLKGAKTAEISKKARVSEAMINHHFGGKLGLYRACIAGFASRRLETLDRVSQPATSREDFPAKLALLIHELFDLHLEDADVTKILLRDVSASKHWSAQIEGALFSFTPRVAAFFADAQRKGILRASCDPLAVASVVYLTLSGLLQADSHIERATGHTVHDRKYREASVKKLLDVVLHGVLEPS